jgi:cell division septal protein FtsQ
MPSPDPKRGRSIKKTLTLAASLLALVAAGWGVRSAMRSPMFLLQVVEIADLPHETPVDASTISQLAGLPVGKINLFDLDLKPVERRVLLHPWIREVRLDKHFPQTLSISVTFREPQALMQSESGALAYVDVDGKVFGQVDLRVQPDLPVLTASTAASTARILEALKLVRAWEGSELSRAARLSQLQWDADRGFRALVSYPLPSSSAPEARGRTFVDLGQDFDGDAIKAQFERLSRVFEYLTSHKVLARQIWADADKKIVVKTTRGS